jgi:hypothetical protein
MGNVVHSTGVTREDVIFDSFNNVKGIVGINQSSGNANIQINAVAMGIGKGFALNEMELGAVCMKDNEVTSEKVYRTDMVVDSFNEGCGVVQVNQTSGDAVVAINYLEFTYKNMELP